MHYQFKKAIPEQLDQIWDILSKAILRRKEDGSNQWQDGYPNPSVVEKDIELGHAYVLMDDDVVAAYCAVLINDEPEYANIKGKWLTEGDFVVFHRVAVSDQFLGRGLSKVMLNFIEDFAVSNDIYSVKVDTNFDNAAMLRIFEKAGYVYCGEVYFRGSARMAYEKVISDRRLA